MNIIQIKKEKNSKMSCKMYIVYTFHLSLHHANFRQFKANQFLKT